MTLLNATEINGTSTATFSAPSTGNVDVTTGAMGSGSVVNDQVVIARRLPARSVTVGVRIAMITVAPGNGNVGVLCAANGFVPSMSTVPAMGPPDHSSLNPVIGSRFVTASLNVARTVAVSE